MARRLQSTVIVLVLVIGIGWSLPTETGYTGATPGPAAYSAADPAEFFVAVRRGRLTLSGYTASAQHEQRLLHNAAEYFPEQRPHAEFRPLGVVPEWWDDATVALIATLATTVSSHARLGDGVLRIGAVVADRAVTEQQLETLRSMLPESTDVDVQLADVDTGTPAAVFCEREFAAFRHDPIYFEESSTRMRASAFPVLQRVVTLADACRDAVISITGHTDASGNEAQNRRLSLARAEAVANYLGQRGIDSRRLQTTGAGSSRPIADNATRYGRGLNRRIEIGFSPR